MVNRIFLGLYCMALVAFVVILATTLPDKNAKLGEIAFKILWCGMSLSGVINSAIDVANDGGKKK